MIAPAARTAWYRDPLTLLGALLMVVLAAVLLRGLIADIADPWRMNDDMRRVIGMRRPALPPPPPGPAEELAAYQRDRWRGSPPAFDLLVTAVERVGDPWHAAKWGTLLLLAAVLVPLGLLGREVAGAAGVFAALALALHADIFVDRAAGTLARGFGLPIVAWLFYGLATGRDRLVLWLMVPAALFYPPVLVVGGSALVVRAVWAAGAGQWRGRWRGLLAHAVAAGALAVGALVWFTGAGEASRPYTYAEALQRPEMSRAGRGPSHVPFEPVWREALLAAERGLSRRRVPTRVSVAAHVALGLLALGVILGRGYVPRRVWGASVCLAGGGAVGYALARLVAFRLYAPDRYLQFSLPVVILALWLAVWVAVCRRWWASPRAPALGAVMAVAGAVAFGGPGRAGSQAFAIRVTPQQQVMIEMIRTLPESAVLSGPADFMDTVFATAHRHTYISAEVMAPISPDEWSWMADRYRRHLAAYYAADWGPVLRLRDAGVTHLFVRVTDLLPTGPVRDEIWYEPFRSEIQQLRAANAARGFVLATPPERAVVARIGRYTLLDLAKLDGPPEQPSP